MNKKKALPIIIGVVAVLAVIGIVVGVIAANHGKNERQKDFETIKAIAGDLTEISQELTKYVDGSWEYDDDLNRVQLYEIDKDYCQKLQEQILAETKKYLKKQKEDGKIEEYLVSDISIWYSCKSGLDNILITYPVKGYFGGSVSFVSASPNASIAQGLNANFLSTAKEYYWHKGDDVSYAIFQFAKDDEVGNSVNKLRKEIELNGINYKYYGPGDLGSLGSTAAAFNESKDCDAIFLIGHGAPHPESVLLDRVQVTRELLRSWARADEEELKWNNVEGVNFYGNEGLSLCMSGESLSQWLPQFDDTIIYTTYCYSARGDAVAEAFLSHGARAYIGYTGAVEIKHSIAMAKSAVGCAAKNYDLASSLELLALANEPDYIYEILNLIDTDAPPSLKMFIRTSEVSSDDGVIVSTDSPQKQGFAAVLQDENGNSFSDEVMVTFRNMETAGETSGMYHSGDIVGCKPGKYTVWAETSEYTSTGYEIEIKEEAGTEQQIVMVMHLKAALKEEPKPEIPSVDASAFPDNLFRNYVFNNFDLDKDGILSADEINAVTEIKVGDPDHPGPGISDLTGIEKFGNLSSLSCDFNHLTSLDVSNNNALENLTFSDNLISSLDVSNYIALSYLHCNVNQLTSLDVSGCTSLARLNCNTNQLTSLNVSGCTSLTRLECRNNKLRSLDVSDNTLLELLYCGSNKLKSLDVSNNPKLEKKKIYADGGVKIIQ